MRGESEGRDLVELNDRLADVTVRLRERAKRRRMLKHAVTALEEETSRLDRLEATCEREDRDVRRLEGFSVHALFYEVLGQKRTRLDSEREEYLAARLKANESLASVLALEAQIDALEAQLAEFGDLEGEHRSVIEAKQRLITEVGHPMAERLSEVTARIADATADRREVEEAIAAGEAALHALDDLAEKLDSANTWGTFDVMGGGLLATAVKHSRMDASVKLAHHARQLLGVFHHELADVEGLPTHDLSVDMSDSLRFADVFLDGFIVDVMVQKRIARSKRAVEETMDAVEDSLQLLDGRLEALTARRQALAGERRQLIEAA